MRPRASCMCRRFFHPRTVVINFMLNTSRFERVMGSSTLLDLMYIADELTDAIG